jgi:hypothetical protein
MQRTFLFAIGLSLLLLPGCGSNLPKTVPASGTVYLDGEPLDNASITLLSEDGVTATAKSDSSGRFSLRTVVGSDLVNGAMPGFHQVGVAKTIMEGGGAEKLAGESDRDMVNRLAGSMTSTPPKQTFVVPQQFGIPSKSGITMDIPTSGSDSLRIDIKSKK